MNNDLKKLQNVELDIYKELKKILDKYNLRYYALGGTFLGAIRHKGFIPWDDDIDIGMKRSDYERFIKIFSEVNNTNIELLNYKKNENYNRYFIKLIDKRIKIKRKDNIKEENTYAWIDVFPLDGTPNNKFLRFIYKIRLLYLICIYRLSVFSTLVNINKKNRPFYEKIIISIGKIIPFEKFLNTKKRLNKLDKFLKKYDYDNSNYVINAMGAYKLKEMFEKKCYEDIKKYKFEDTYIYGPSNYDKILRKMYGDYMKEPENKNKHESTIVK